MKLTALRLHNVRRFGGCGVAIEGIGDGVNVLTAANEQGKSTCFEALHALFFLAHSGTGKAVQLLRPYSGGSPLIEADIVTPDGAFRLAKQFYAGRRAEVRDLATGRLVAQADEAEQFIAGLTRGGNAGPAGLLWVRQGLTGLEKRSNTEEESEKRVRESLLTSVQGEVEAMTGGTQMSRILDACEEELFRLVTATLRPKTGGRYAEAIAERDRLQHEATRLAADVAALHDALERRRAARRRLAELEAPEPAEARRVALAAAEAAHEAAQRRAEALKTLAAGLDLLQLQCANADAALADYDAAIAEAAQLQQRVTVARTARDAAIAARQALQRRVDAAQSEIERADSEEAGSRALLDRLDRALRAREAALRRAELDQRLQQAEAARAELESAEGALAGLVIPPAALAEMQQREVELARLRSARTASLPSLRLDYRDETAPRLLIGDTTLPDGEEQPFDTLRLDLPGIGALTLRANRDESADLALEKAEAAQAALFARHNVASLAASQARSVAAQAEASRRDLARQRLGDLAPEGLTALRGERDRLAAEASGPDAADTAALEGRDPAALTAALAAAGGHAQAARNILRELQPRLQQATEAQIAAEAALAAAEADLGGVAARLGPAEQQAARREQLAAECAQLAPQRAAAEAELARMREAAPDPRATEASLQRLRSVEQAVQQEKIELGQVLADLNGQIGTRADTAIEEAWQETKDALAAAEAAVARFETEVATLERLRAALTAARSAARDLYLKPVVSELLPMLRLLFDDVNIAFDETTLLPHRVRRNGQEEEVDRLSGGMREQLSVLTRLAFARLLARDGRAAPVILDDALVYSDDDRIEKMFDALHRQAVDQQIIVFSCRQRAFAQLGGNVLHMRDWSPSA